MTVNFIRAYGGTAERDGPPWDLTWPNGDRQEAVVFAPGDAHRQATAQHLTLENPQVRGLAERLPRFAPGQPVPCLALEGLPAAVCGFWSLWQITLHTPERDRSRIMPLFWHEDGRVLVPTARFIWDRMISAEPAVAGSVEGDAATAAFKLAEEAAREHGRSIYHELVHAHRTDVSARRERGEYSFGARRRSVARIGLASVRNHRLAQLAAEEQSWRAAIDWEEEVSPGLVPLIIVRVDPTGDHR